MLIHILSNDVLHSFINLLHHGKLQTLNEISVSKFEANFSDNVLHVFIQMLFLHNVIYLLFLFKSNFA